MGSCFWTDFVGCDEACGGAAHPAIVSGLGRLFTFNETIAPAWPYADKSVPVGDLIVTRSTHYVLIGYDNTQTLWPAVNGEAGAISAALASIISNSGQTTSPTTWAPVSSIVGSATPVDATWDIGFDFTAFGSLLPLQANKQPYWYYVLLDVLCADSTGALWHGASIIDSAE